MPSCCCRCTERLTLILSGLYLWGVSLFTIMLVEWDYEKTILFMQGEYDPETAEHMQRDVLNALLVGLNLACGFQMFTVIFFLLHGVFMKKRGLIVTWLWFHTFQMAFFVVYLFAGVLVFSIMEDKDKILLLVYGGVNVLIDICIWRCTYDYVKEERVLQREVEPDILFEIA
ncbi:hypothetical protein C0J52_26435 [Blattella germanica]|nr:hypothetical protein C0J52_26435 [Blattella germanica]